MPKKAQETEDSKEPTGAYVHAVYNSSELDIECFDALRREFLRYQFWYKLYRQEAFLPAFIRLCQCFDLIKPLGYQVVNKGAIKNVDALRAKIDRALATKFYPKSMVTDLDAMWSQVLQIRQAAGMGVKVKLKKGEKGGEAWSLD